MLRSHTAQVSKCLPTESLAPVLDLMPEVADFNAEVAEQAADFDTEAGLVETAALEDKVAADAAVLRVAFPCVLEFFDEGIVLGLSSV